MLARGVANDEALDELENHLREEMENRLQAGTDLTRACETAVERIGQPDVLKTEFAKINGVKNSLAGRLREAILTVANIPNPNLVTTMNTTNLNTNIEPGWATYLKSGAFIAPAIFVWSAFAIFVLPKLREICQKSEVVFPSFIRTVLGVSLFVHEHVVLFFGATALLLILLEWRSRSWPRYRRAVFGVSVFAVNTLVLLSLGLMVIMAILAAMPHAK